VPVYAETCGSERLVLRLEPQGAVPLRVEVSRVAEGAFRRVAGVGVSPMLQVDDFQRVPAAQREPFERLVAWMAQHPDAIAFGGGGGRTEALRVPAERTSVGGGSEALLIGALALAILARVGARAPAVRDRLAALALFGVALPLRLLLGAWGPLRINGLGPLWVMAAAVDAKEAAAYGPGYAEVFGPLVRHLLLAPDHALFATNVFISALVPVLVFSLARPCGIDRARAVFAGLIVSFDPVSIRIAATESYVPVIAALTMTAAVGFAASALHASRRAPRRALCIALAASLCCAEAARIHPAAWLPVALAPLATAGAAGLSVRRRLASGLVAIGISGAVVALTSAANVFHAYESMLTGETMTAAWMWPFDGARSALVALATLAALLLVARPRWPLAWGALSLVVLLSTRGNYGQSVLWQESFDRLYLAPLLVGAVTLVPSRFARTRAFAPLAAVALLALFARSAPRVFRGHTTDQEEYDWARQELARLPPSCRIAYVAFAGRRNLFLPTYLLEATGPAAALRLDGRAPIDVSFALGPVGCAYYARTSLCTSVEGRDVCADVERQLVLEPVASASFPAVPSNQMMPYDRDRVESALLRIAGYAKPR